MAKVIGEDRYECDCGCGAAEQRVKDQRYESAMPAGWIRVKVQSATMMSAGPPGEFGFATVSCMRQFMADLDCPWAEP